MRQILCPYVQCGPSYSQGARGMLWSTFTAAVITTPQQGASLERSPVCFHMAHSSATWLAISFGALSPDYAEHSHMKSAGGKGMLHFTSLAALVLISKRVTSLKPYSILHIPPLLKPTLSSKTFSFMYIMWLMEVFGWAPVTSLHLRASILQKSTIKHILGMLLWYTWQWWVSASVKQSSVQFHATHSSTT